MLLVVLVQRFYCCYFLFLFSCGRYVSIHRHDFCCCRLYRRPPLLLRAATESEEEEREDDKNSDSKLPARGTHATMLKQTSTSHAHTFTVVRYRGDFGIRNFYQIHEEDPACPHVAAPALFLVGYHPLHSSFWMIL